MGQLCLQMWTFLFHILLLQHSFGLLNCQKRVFGKYNLRRKIFLVSTPSLILRLLLCSGSDLAAKVDIRGQYGSCHTGKDPAEICEIIHVSEHRPSDNFIYLDVQMSGWINSESFQSTAQWMV